MNENIKTAILNKIREYDTVIITRHIRPDGDALGSSAGLYNVLRDSFPDKKIHIAADDGSDAFGFLGIVYSSLGEKEYSGALLIVLDTATEERISDSKYALADYLIKIDHHPDIKPYGDLSWVEDTRSSCSEMVAELCLTGDGLTISKEAAKCFYTGITTDTGRFRFNPKPDELRIAARLLEIGIDTERLFAEIYLDTFDYLKFRAYVFTEMKQSENGVAYIYVDRKMQEKWKLGREEASASVSILENIRGDLIWIAFIDNPDGTIRVRLRSRFISINEIAEKYRGGGHEKAAGATLYDKSEMKLLIDDCDRALGEYKENNDGWI